jgi:hypothetical protein
MGIYKSSGKVANPVAGLSLLVGLIGAAFAIILWFFRYNPDSTFLGDWGANVAAGGTFHDQLRWLAATCGTIAILASILASFGGRGRWTTVAGIVFGMIGLSYPILTWVNVVSQRVPSRVI